MKRTELKPVNVYAVTKAGNALTDEGTRAATEMALRQSQAPEDATGALVHTGPDLLDAGALAGLLDTDPGAMVVLSTGDALTLYAGDSVAQIASALRNGGGTSWEILDRATAGGTA